MFTFYFSSFANKQTTKMKFSGKENSMQTSNMMMIELEKQNKTKRNEKFFNFLNFL